MSIETDMAWCAGFFDGEGHIRCFYSKGSYTLRIQIGQKDRRVLDRFRRIMKNIELYSWDISILGPRFNGNYNKGNNYILQTNNHNALKAFEAMKPYLDEVKLEQGEQAIKKWQEGRGHLKVVAS